jgi:hypothetical protein
MQQILALDLGSKTGWAATRPDGTIESGTWILSDEKTKARDKELGLDRTGDSRFYSLLRHLKEHNSKNGAPHLCVFEDVQFSTYTLQTQLWASLRAAIWATYAPWSSTTVMGVAVGTLKHFATGHGAATKPMMAAWLAHQHPKLYKKATKPTKTRLLETHLGRPIDDNEIDAIHLLFYAREHANA